MADFVHSFWGWYIAAIVIGGFVWMVWLLINNSKEKMPASGKAEDTGHVWDEDLKELNTPLPRWWLYMFYITIVFGAIYLILYPGLGAFKGLLGWTELKQYQAEVEQAEARYGPLYEKFLQQDLAKLATDEDAMKTGERLYVNYCAVCHGSDARGARGFPNLRDSEWLYGGDPQTIKTTIMNGRQGVMPSWEAALGGQQGVEQVTAYVLQLSGRKVDEELASAGKEKFDMFCVSCHGADGTGNQALGAPDLTNNIWLYGGSRKSIMETITEGRNGRMPAHAEFLGEAKVHVLSAYVYRLAHEFDQ